MFVVAMYSSILPSVIIFSFFEAYLLYYICWMVIQQKKYIAYYRVSTQQQGDSGLGLEAQQQTIEQYCKDYSIILKMY